MVYACPFDLVCTTSSTYYFTAMTNKTKLLRNTCFGLTALAIIILAAATIIETLYGTEVAVTYFYGSPVFVALWAAIALSSICYLIVRKTIRRKAVFLLHAAFAIILSGAFITHIWGEQGSIHLRCDDAPANTFTTSDGDTHTMPFHISLDNFTLTYYPGTQAPMDFVSNITIHDGTADNGGTVSMNNVYSYRGYRFYQSTYDSDGRGSTLAVSHDPYGILVTYIGYALLLLSMLLFFFDRRSRFRQLLRHPSLRTSACVTVLASTALAAAARDTPPALPEGTAARFGDLYVYYNDRVCPLQTLARDFTVKLYGKPSYKGLSAEQVFTGWFFYYDSWKEEPMIRIKSREARHLLGIDGRYARLTDFIDNRGYKLEGARQTGTGIKDLRGVSEADEKFSLASMVCTGNALKLFPYRDSTTNDVTWYSVTDRLPATMPQPQWTFVRYCMNYIAEQVGRKDFVAVDTLLVKVKEYQRKEATGRLPDEMRFKAEKIYNTLDFTRPAAMTSLAIGIVSFFFYCRRMTRQHTGNRRSRVSTLLAAMMAIVLVYIITILTLRGIIGGHFPASNGFETMLLMAACIAVITIAAYRRFETILSFGFMLCGFSLLVAMLGEANPSVTQLLPVLSSPLLSIHVAVIMISYSLFGFAMFNGIAAVIINRANRRNVRQIERLQVMSRLILYPAVFLLTAGIFIGAVWANVSWGRYWGWDPKETWALITLLVYTAALHTDSLPALRRPMAFHWFTIIAFLSVLITYFGANFIMAGLHSYA